MAPLTGQELYKRHERKKIKDNPDDTRHRLNADELDTRLNGDYNTLDSTERRAWVVRAEELAALPDDFHHQIITAEDIYCNNEEVRKIRRKAMKRKREVKSTDEIHRRLKRRWTRLNPNQRDNFLDEEIVINEARRLIRRRIRGDPVVKKKAYEYTHEPVMEMQIAREMGTRFTELEKYQWKCHKIIGEGGNGRAMLFRKADDNNNTLKLVVAKRDKHGDGMKAEMDIHKRTMDHSNYGYPISPHIVKSIGMSYGQHTEEQPREKKDTLYLEYYPHGDLSDMFARYHSESSKKKFILPEPFCWYLLHSFAKAVVYLEDGGLPSKWRPLAHIDFKPGNVFLGPPSVGKGAMWWHRQYPTPVVGDLGGVITYPIVPDDKPYDNKEMRDCLAYLRIPGPNRGYSTNGYLPFEHLKPRYQNATNAARKAGDPDMPTFDPNKRGKPPLHVDQWLRIHTTVWQIGMTLYTGMSLYKTHPDQLYSDHGEYSRALPYKDWRDTYPTREPSRFLADAMDNEVWDPRHSLCPRYSDHLIQLVYQCLNPDARKRPTPKELYKETSEVMKDIEAMCPEENGLRPRDVLVYPNKYPIRKRVVRDDTPSPPPKLPQKPGRNKRQPAPMPHIPPGNHDVREYDPDNLPDYQTGMT